MARPSEDILACEVCGHRVGARTLEGSPRYRRRTLAAIRVPPDAAEPAEWAVVCPECNALDSFVETDDAQKKEESHEVVEDQPGQEQRV